MSAPSAPETRRPCIAFVNPQELPDPPLTHEVLKTVRYEEPGPGAVRYRLDLLQRKAPDLLDGVERLLEREGPIGLAFDEFRPNGLADAAVFIEGDNLADTWFIGDLHGDFLTLEAALALIRHASLESGDASHCILFIGDLIDDGVHGYEVLLAVMELMFEAPDRVGWLVGNHDLALGHDPERGFFSRVSPSQFATWLNDQADDPMAQRAGRLMIRLVERLPRAFYFPDGLLAVHGGIPHSDLWDSLEKREDLNRSECLQDYVWTRAHERARRRIPNRATHDCEYGAEDFANFCAMTARLMPETPVKRLICGHQHINAENRYACPARYEQHPLLIINTLCHRLSREIFGPYERYPCVARRIAGQLPEVWRIQLAPELIRDIYPEPVLAEQPLESA